MILSVTLPTPFNFCNSPFISDKVGRNVIDNFETAIRRYFSGSKREKKGIIVAFSFTSGAYNEAHRVGLEGNIKIELKTVEELLNET